MTTTAGPELLNHFSVAIYPFVHDLSSRNRTARLAALESRWAPWWSRLDDDGLATALESTAFFLPYVRGLLYPEVPALQNGPPGSRFAGWARRLRGWSDRGLTQFTHRLPRSTILRLTARESVLRPLAEFRVPRHRSEKAGPPELAACLDWVDALLFPSGIGFLLLKFRLRHDRPHLAQLIDLNQTVRTVHPLGRSWALSQLFFCGGDAATVPDLMNYLTQGLVRPPLPVREGGPFHSLGISSGETPYTDTEAGIAYGERCQLLSYACVDLTAADESTLPAGPFGSGEDRLLYEYAACIGLGRSASDPTWVPSPEQAARVRAENRLAMWRCWKAMALKESIVFLGTEDLPFNRRSLPHTVEEDYLPLYLYTLHQKFQLMVFANDLMREVAQVESHLRGARELLRRFIAFRNRFWFSEVTRKPQGGDLYRLMQQSMDVPGLYQMAVASVKEAKEYYEDRWDRQVRLAVTLLGLGGPLAALLGWLQPMLNGMPMLVVLTAAVVLVGALAIRLLRRKQPLWMSRRKTAPRLLAFPKKGPTGQARAG
jgi:hypothetical protein